MLKELYDYAIQHDLAAMPGFKPKAVKAYYRLSAKGEFLSVDLTEKGTKTYAPDIGAAANGTRYCNLLIEKAKIPLCIIEDDAKDKNIPTKTEFYLSALESGSYDEPLFAVLATSLRDDARRKEMVDALEEAKLKPGDAIGFIIDGTPLEKSTKYLPWWESFRQMFSSNGSGDNPRCLITGDLRPAMATVPKVSGLISVGGHTAGDALLCFDKAAFQSYGLEKSANAPVSEEAITAVNAALGELISHAPTFGNAKLLHWYSQSIPVREDPVLLVLDPFGNISEAPEEDTSAAERDALRAFREMADSITKGNRPEVADARFYILPISGANGRMMVRGWYEGDYELLRRNIVTWFDDISLISPWGTGPAKPPKLKALCIRLLRPGGDPTKLFQRMDEELSSLLQRLFYAIIHGTAIPDEVPHRVLRWIRSAILKSEEDGTSGKIDNEVLAFQLLRGWLVRKQRMKGEEIRMKEELNLEGRSPAYYCGCLLAVYSEIQRKAMPEVGVSIAQRFYAAASTNPAMVMGRIAQVSQHHLAKLDGTARGYFENRLSEIAVAMGSVSAPKQMTQEQQTEFALGYYQQRADLRAWKGNNQNASADEQEKKGE